MTRKWTRGVLGAALCVAFSSAAGAQTCPLTQPMVVASGLNSPFRLVVDDQFVYYLGYPPKSPGVYRVDKDGGTPQLIVDGGADTNDSEMELAVDATSIYVMYPFFDQGSSGLGGGAILVYDKAGTLLRGVGSTPSIPGDCHQPSLTDFAVAPDGDIYWIQKDEPGIFGGPCEELAQSGIGRDPAGAASATLLLRTFGHASHIRADATHIFWDDAQRIERMQAGGGAVQELAVHVQPVVSLAIDPNYIYWSYYNDSTTQGTYQIVGVGQQVQVVPVGLFDLQTDGSYVYGNNPRTGTGAPFNVYRMKPNGHGLVNLAKGGGNGLAVDDTFVYYYNANRTAIMKWCKI